MDNEPSTLNRALAFLCEVNDILQVKNAEYGNSASNPIRIFSACGSSEQLLVRIDDKLSRIARGGHITRELLIDLTGYFALLAGKMEEEGR